MSRTQITLDPEIQRLARRRASDLGVSFAEYVRRLITRDLERREGAADPSRLFDLGASGGSEVARNKDEMLAEAFGARSRRPRRFGPNRRLAFRVDP
jgi:hypothetical protein